jgi:hypothetical protein
MTEPVLNTLIRTDGRRRIVVIQCADRLYGFRQDQLVSTRLGEKWWPFIRYSTICGSVEIAEQEAKAQIAWLRPGL